MVNPQDKVKYNFVYNKRNKKLSKDDTAPLLLEVYFSRNDRKFINTGLNLSPEQWDSNKKRVTPKHQNYIHFNLMINNMMNGIEQYELELLNGGKRLTRELLEAFIKNDMTKESFQQFAENELTADNSIKHGTRKELKYTINVLNDFKPDGIKFSDIDYSLVQEFDRYLRGLGLSQNTIHKHHKHVSRFLNIAIRKRQFQTDDNPYLHFKSKKVASDRVNLTFEEVAKIENKDLAIPELIQVRDMFLFSCYTGLRFSDMQALKQDNIIEYNDGLSIKFSMEKVMRPIELPLYLLFKGKPERIIKPYMALKRDYVFPRISDVHINRQLKIIAGACSIGKPISFHYARHTFGTFLADITGNPFIIKELMGHQRIDTSMIYIHSSTEMINKQLRKTTWKV